MHLRVHRSVKDTGKDEAVVVARTQFASTYSPLRGFLKDEGEDYAFFQRVLHCSAVAKTYPSVLDGADQVAQFRLISRACHLWEMSAEKVHNQPGKSPV